MKQESINKALDIIIEQISNSDIEQLDKMELLLNLNTFLTHYDEAIKQRFDKPKGLRRINDNKRSTRNVQNT